MHINKLLSVSLACSLCFTLGSLQAHAEEEAQAAQAVETAAATASAEAPAAVSATANETAPEAATNDNAANPTEEAAAQDTAKAEEEAKKEPVRDDNGFYVGGPVYISDNNKVWTRSGPGEGYRVTGARSVGDELKFLRYSDNRRWAQVQYEGDNYWILVESLTPNMCGRPLADKLQAKIDELQSRLDNYDNELMQRTKKAEAEVARLTKLNHEMQATIVNKDATINELDELYRDYADRLETKDLDMQMRWWMQGAIIALCGAIAGVVFVFIPRPSRKQKRDRY